MSAPKKWMCKNNTHVLVDTPHTIRARELRDLYNALNLPMLSIDERLQILLHIKYTAKEFDCNLTRDLVDLIDREGDLISRGRSENSLEGLRKRISNLFLQFIKTPEFNPEAMYIQSNPAPHSGKTGDVSVYYCRSCTSYKPSTDFYLSTTMKQLSKCKDCHTKTNIAIERSSESAYKLILNRAKAHEALKYKTDTSQKYSTMSVLQDTDMHYLIDILWNKKSAISGVTKLEELSLTRWNVHEPLSPWNCILLTISEAATHEMNLASTAIKDVYAAEFCEKIAQKHILASKHFEQLPSIAEYLNRNYEQDSLGKIALKKELESPLVIRSLENKVSEV